MISAPAATAACFKARSLDVKSCGWIAREWAIRKINFNGTLVDKWHPVSKDECSGVVTCQIYHEHLGAIELQRSNVQHFINSPPTSRDLRHLDENGSPKKVEYFSRNLARPSLTGLVQNIRRVMDPDKVEMRLHCRIWFTSDTPSGSTSASSVGVRDRFNILWRPAAWSTGISVLPPPYSRASKPSRE